MILMLFIVFIVVSLLFVVFVLLYCGKGGGLLLMFGGFFYSNLFGLLVVECNFDCLIIIVGVVWIICVIGFGLLYKNIG